MKITENEKNMILKLRYMAKTVKDAKQEFIKTRKEMKKQFRVDWKHYKEHNQFSDKLEHAIDLWECETHFNYFDSSIPQKSILPYYLGKYETEWSLDVHVKKTNYQFQNELFKLFLLYMNNNDILLDSLTN